MSLTDSTTRYSFGVTINAASSTPTGIAFDYLCRGEMDDSMAIALVAAIKGLAWPMGTTLDATIAKDDVAEVFYVADLTATPPAFV